MESTLSAKTDLDKIRTEGSLEGAKQPKGGSYSTGIVSFELEVKAV